MEFRDIGVGVGLECVRGPVGEPIDGGARDEGREHAHLVRVRVGVRVRVRVR